jgi:hypothetical protein
VNWKFIVENQIDKDIDAEDKATQPGTTIDPNPKWRVEPHENQVVKLHSKESDINSQGGGLKFGLTCGCTPQRAYFYVLGTKCGISSSSFDEAQKNIKDMAQINFGEIYTVQAWYDSKKA